MLDLLNTLLWYSSFTNSYKDQSQLTNIITNTPLLHLAILRLYCTLVNVQTLCELLLVSGAWQADESRDCGSYNIMSRNFQSLTTQILSIENHWVNTYINNWCTLLVSSGCLSKSRECATLLRTRFTVCVKRNNYSVLWDTYVDIT